MNNKKENPIYSEGVSSSAPLPAESKTQPTCRFSIAKVADGLGAKMSGTDHPHEPAGRKAVIWDFQEETMSPLSSDSPSDPQLIPTICVDSESDVQRYTTSSKLELLSLDTQGHRVASAAKTVANKDSFSVTDKLPNIEHYRNLDSIVGTGGQSRPTLRELHDQDFGESAKEEAEAVVLEMMDDLMRDRKPHEGDNVRQFEFPKETTLGVKFGWIRGVFVRCVLNILGVMLYLRLSWVSGQAGIGFGSLIVLLSAVVTTVTSISMCAISTNGDMKGGGAYFMISRSLGPEFGGSIGLMFSFANAVGAAMYVVGFSETVRDLMKINGIQIVDGSVNDIRIVSLAIILVLLMIVYIGVEFESKAQMVLLGILTLSYVNFVFGTLLPPGLEKTAQGITGYTWDTFSQNFLPDWRGQTFFSVFAVFFPAATGIMAGANISGDLADPRQSIPKGTLLAIFVTSIIYLSAVWLTGATCLRDASGLIFDDHNVSKPVPCSATNESCEFGLLNYFQIMELESIWGPLVTAGIIAATLSSALSSLISAPKVFQAVCKDRLFPYIEYFARGYGKGDEPRRAYLLAFVIAVGIILIGDLNAIAPIISNFFLASYALINYACFDASFAESPGFRPAFKFYNMWLSLFGAVICVGVMFVISWWTALLTFLFILMLYVYILRRKPGVNWGSSGQSHSYKSALQSMLKLAQTEEHIKNYRPQILALIGNPVARPSFLDFVSNITKDNCLLICGHVVVHSSPERMRGSLLKLRDKIAAWLFKRKTKAFYLPVAAKSLVDGVAQLLQLSGLGKLRPNIVLLGYKNNWLNSSLDDINAYVNMIHSAFDCNYSVGILRVGTGLDFSEQMKNYNHEDVDHLGVPELERIPNKDYSFSKLPRSETSSSAFGLTNRRSASPESVVPKKGFSFFSLVHHDTEVVCDEKQQSNVRMLEHPSCRRHNAEDTAAVLQSMENAQMMLQASINQFKQHQKTKTNSLDVWWLYDDGGLSLLIPHLLTCHRSYLEGCKLRVFTIASSRNALEQEQRSMAALLSRFRIDYTDVFVLPDVTKKPKSSTMREFENIIAKFKKSDGPLAASEDRNQCSSGLLTDSELVAHAERSNRQMRIRELLMRHSLDATLVCLTLPVPRKGVLSSCLYMAWLDLLTKDMPPMLLLRGNQQSVLTFYS